MKGQKTRNAVASGPFRWPTHSYEHPGRDRVASHL